MFNLVDALIIIYAFPLIYIVAVICSPDCYYRTNVGFNVTYVNVGCTLIVYITPFAEIANGEFKKAGCT